MFSTSLPSIETNISPPDCAIEPPDDLESQIASDASEPARIMRAMRTQIDELKRSNLAKDHLLAEVSHELRAPLNVVIGFTGTLMMKLPGPLNADQEDQLRTIRASAEHLLSLVTDVLDVSRLNGGKLELRRANVSGPEILHQVASALRPQAVAKGLKLDVRLADPEITFQTDRRAFLQILLNLTINAIKFTQTGSVLLELSQICDNGHSSIILSVTDTGAGLRREDQARLFRPFERLDGKSKNKPEGAGLGLYISQGLAKMLGGKIEIESEFGLGSRFTLTLPQG